MPVIKNNEITKRLTDRNRKQNDLAAIRLSVAELVSEKLESRRQLAQGEAQDTIETAVSKIKLSGLPLKNAEYSSAQSGSGVCAISFARNLPKHPERDSSALKVSPDQQPVRERAEQFLNDRERAKTSGEWDAFNNA